MIDVDESFAGDALGGTMSDRANHPAYPAGHYPGMTIRDYLAAKAMQEFVGMDDMSPVAIAEEAVRTADAMMARLDRESEDPTEPEEQSSEHWVTKLRNKVKQELEQKKPEPDDLWECSAEGAYRERVRVIGIATPDVILFETEDGRIRQQPIQTFFGRYQYVSGVTEF